MNEIERILRINAYIQHTGQLTYGGKAILCVALDRVCSFKATAEQIMLDDTQLAEIYRQTREVDDPYGLNSVEAAHEDDYAHARRIKGM